MGLARCCGLRVGSGSCPAPVGCCHLVLLHTYLPGSHAPVLWQSDEVGFALLRLWGCASSRGERAGGTLSLPLCVFEPRAEIL